MTVITFERASPSKPVSAPPHARCPVHLGYQISCGWKKLFWRTVAEIGEPVYLLSGWLVPVMYRSGVHGLIYYRFGDAEVIQWDSVEEVTPNWDCAAWHLRNSISMPRIVSVEDGVVVLHVEQMIDESDDETHGWTGDEHQAVQYELKLYGVIASREDRRDEVDVIRSGAIV